MRLCVFALNTPPRLPVLLSRIALALALAAASADAAVLWSDPGLRLAKETGDGRDILHGATSRDDTDSDTLYFKFRVDPLSDVSTEEYYAGFQLFEGDEKRLAVGNSPKAWAYSAFYTAETFPTNKTQGDYDLSSARSELFHEGDVQPYELPRRGNERVIVFKVQFIPGGDDLVTVWLSPDLTLGATEESQSPALTTRFKADASFNQIRVRHMGGGGGWNFSDMAVATSFNDFIVARFWQTWWFNGLMVLVLVSAVAAGVRGVEKKKYQRQLQHAEQERVLQRERARIAQDLHDDLGSSLARISLLSNLAKQDKHHTGQVEVHLEKIIQSADETVRALEEIVWAVKPGSDSLSSLVEYIAHFASELFESDTARCRLDLPNDLPALPLPPEVRHDIFLVVKEALTNVLRHAGAKEVSVEARVNLPMLEIVIRDDGRGFDLASPPPTMHNGLENMRRRAATIGGQLEMTGAPGLGTTVRLTVKLPAAG